MLDRLSKRIHNGRQSHAGIAPSDYSRIYKKLLDPNYQYAFGTNEHFTLHQSIPHKQWTTVQFVNTAISTGNAYWNDDKTILTMPSDSEGVAVDIDNTGLWVTTMSAGFDNTKKGLDPHLRKVAIEQVFGPGGAFLPVSSTDFFFDPAAISNPIHDEERISIFQTYVQDGYVPEVVAAGVPMQLRVRVWHNATVNGGTPTSLDMMNLGSLAPRLERFKASDYYPA